MLARQRTRILNFGWESLGTIIGMRTRPALQLTRELYCPSSRRARGTQRLLPDFSHKFSGIGRGDRRVVEHRRSSCSSSSAGAGGGGLRLRQGGQAAARVQTTGRQRQDAVNETASNSPARCEVQDQYPGTPSMPCLHPARPPPRQERGAAASDAAPAWLTALPREVPARLG